MLESHSARETLLAKSTPQGFPFLRKICIFALSVGFILLATQSIQQKMGAKSPEISISAEWDIKEYPPQEWSKYPLPPQLSDTFNQARYYGWERIQKIDRAHIVPKSWIPWIWDNLKEEPRAQFAKLIIGPNKDTMYAGDFIWGEGNVRLGDKDQNKKINGKFDPVFEKEADEPEGYKFDDKTRKMLEFLSTPGKWKKGFGNVVKPNLFYMKPLIESNKIQSSGICKNDIHAVCEPLEVDINKINDEDRKLLMKIWKLNDSNKDEIVWRVGSIETGGQENTDPQKAGTSQNQASASSSSSGPSSPRAKNT